MIDFIKNLFNSSKEEKQIMKRFMIDFGVHFASASLVLTLLTLSLYGRLTESFWPLVSLIMVFSFFYSLNNGKRNNVEDLTVNNYWKLKKELDKKVSKSRKKK